MEMEAGTGILGKGFAHEGHIDTVLTGHPPCQMPQQYRFITGAHRIIAVDKVDLELAAAVFGDRRISPHRNFMAGGLDRFQERPEFLITVDPVDLAGFCPRPRPLTMAA